MLYVLRKVLFSSKKSFIEVNIYFIYLFVVSLSGMKISIIRHYKFIISCVVSLGECKIYVISQRVNLNKTIQKNVFPLFCKQVFIPDVLYYNMNVSFCHFVEFFKILDSI